ncbi:MAG: MgtC/SapB family protein [Candidatus Omnitrophota bacterium]|nr:MgtC/SapB family protein [Candidatus Omnitrophota bacterium]
MLNEWIIIFRLVLAAVLSGVIGFEREFHGRAAGFRTHILLCVGSTLVMLTSIHIFDAYYTKGAVDPARIAAGVITGIGFLGAGTIMHSRSSIRGLTTAASLWVVAGIGLAAGSGLYFAAVLTTMIAIITLMLFSRLEHAMIRKDWYKTIFIETREGAGQLKAIRALLEEYRIEITDFDVEQCGSSGNMILRLGVKLNNNNGNEIISDIAHLDGVKHAKWQMD